MPKGKVKTLAGVARALGKQKFLQAAGYYTCHVRDTVADTIWEMESRNSRGWNSPRESAEMVEDYNYVNGIFRVFQYGCN